MASGCMIRIYDSRRIRFHRLPMRELIARVRMNFPATDRSDPFPTPPRLRKHDGLPDNTHDGEAVPFLKDPVSGGFRGPGDLEELRLAEVGAEYLQADGEAFPSIEVGDAAGDGDARNAGEVGGEGENIG